jgi:hypothetical protein
MMTAHELTRLRRQMHRRIRVLVALRRVDILAPAHPPRQRADPGPRGAESGQPAPEN